ncbi:MAG: hypothetical protein HDT33_10250 [Clostridiales bacterium]|nr:hypothetical protein [Clostridiales bacterium]
MGTVILLVLGGLFAAFGLFLAAAIVGGRQGDSGTVAMAAVMAVVIFLIPGVLMLVLGIRKLQTKRRDSDPERSRLVCSIRRHLPAEQAGLPLDKLFAVVDQDLSGGQEFGKDVVLGQEWVLVGDLAVPIRRIRGVFLQISAHRTQYTYISSHIITVCDDTRECGTAGFLANGDQATECYKALCTAAPWAMRGGLNEQGELMTLSPERFNQWNIELERRQAGMD